MTMEPLLRHIETIYMHYVEGTDPNIARSSFDKMVQNSLIRHPNSFVGNQEHKTIRDVRSNKLLHRLEASIHDLVPVKESPNA